MIEMLQHEFQRPFGNHVLVFSIILAIILISPVLLKRLRIPGIIGLILSGLLVGPHGLNLIEKNAAIDLFSTIGLLYIMFIAGLELDINEFRKNRNKSLVFGSLTFLLPLIVGFPVCYYLLGFDFWASLLTSSMFSTHTLVAYPIVSRLGVSKNRAVAITVGGTILTDTAVLLLLAIILSSSKGSIGPAFWIQLIAALAVFTVIMFYVIPRIAAWFFKKLESERHSHYIFVLLVVFIAAFLAEMAGVEPIIGAFVSGLVLNRLIPHTSVLMNRIEFIGNALFIPFFLISVGMLVDLGVLLNGPAALVIAAVLTAVALLGKWLAALTTKIIYSFSSEEGNLIFGLSSSHAAATLAVILVGFREGLLDENILNGTIILILVTCVVASFVTERSGKALVRTKDTDIVVNKVDNAYPRQILLPLANLQNFNKLLEFGSLIRDKIGADTISVLSVVPNNEEAELNLQKARNTLRNLANEALTYEQNVNLIATIDHNVPVGIARTARETGADLIVMGWPQRQGIISKLIGDGLDSIVQHTHKTTAFCHFVLPLSNHKQIKVLIPPLAELEIGFLQWFTVTGRLGVELSTPITFYCDELTGQALRQCYHKTGSSAKISYETVEVWDSIIKSNNRFATTDLLVVIGSRRGAASYHSMLDNLPERIERICENNSRIVLFPEQQRVDYVNERYKDVDGEPLARGIETMNRIGKGVSSFFKKTE